MDNLLSNLNKEQLAAVKHIEGPLLIVAGAGTGKTTVITRRIAYLIENKLAKPEEILALTFTEKAATEMVERVDLLLPLGYVDTWISTFHSFCERILKNHALDIGLPNDFELLDDTRQWILIHDNFEKFNLNYYRPLGNPNKFISALLSHFSKCKDEIISPEDYLSCAEKLTLSTDSSLLPKQKKHKENSGYGSNEIDTAEIMRVNEIANAYHVYQKLLLDNNFLDFGDLINYCLDLFKKRPNILKHYQKRFKFIMVDEFQDTNFAQYQLIKMLADDGHNITVVGDDDQSIYKFRGASVSNILKFKDDFPKFKEVTLIENYRSSREILDLAYKFIQKNNPDRLEIKLGINKELKSNTKEKGVIEVLEAEDAATELNAIAKKILEIKKSETQSSWNDFAILIRSNNAADQLLPTLESSNIPYTFYANTGLYKKPIILDLLAYFKLINNVHDSFSFYRVLNMEIFRLSIHEIAAILELARKKTLSLYETVKLVSLEKTLEKTSLENIDKLLHNLNNHHILSQIKGAAECAVEIIKDLSLAKRLEEETAENAENRELIEQFYKKIEEFENKNKDKSLNNFLHHLELEQEAGDEGKINFNPNLGPESLKVMTIHSSKGLEFKHVFVINLVDKRFPSVNKKDSIEIPQNLIKDILPEGDFHIQEERRLFYVAITRAKKNLFLTWAKDYGGKQAKKPSQFLVESGLVPGDKVNKATGKVVFSKPKNGLKEVFKSLPDKFSYSQIKDFDTCPLKYKYQYYLKLPVKGSQYLSFGNTMHKVFEEYLKTFKEQSTFKQQDLFGLSKKPVELPAFSYLEKLYEKNWIDEWYPTKKEKELFRIQGKELLKKFYDQSLIEMPNPKYIEQSFILFLDSYRLVGRIDRADQINDGVIIYDYKTGKAPKKSEKRDIDQLYIYQWAMQEYLREKVSGLKYWYLRESENQFIVESLATPAQIENLKSELKNQIEKILETIKYDTFKEAHKSAKNHDCEFEFLE